MNSPRSQAVERGAGEAPLSRSATKAKPASEKRPVERIEHEGLLES